MIFKDKGTAWAECEKLGEAAVQANLDAGFYGMTSALPRQWLLEKAAARRVKKDRWTRWGAIFAAIAALTGILSNLRALIEYFSK